jgi:hypothetical protein
VEAIFFEDDLPEQWANFLGLNRQYFTRTPRVTDDQAAMKENR